MKKIIGFEDFNKINWFNNFTKKEVLMIKSQFESFPENKYLNISTIQLDLFEYEGCDDYQFLVNKLINKVTNRFSTFYIESFNCLKKNKIELVINGKKFKKAFRVNGSRFDIEALIDFLNKVLTQNNLKEQLYLLDSGSDILYPILINPSLLNEAKINEIIAIRY